jgi:hypothetical protein
MEEKGIHPHFFPPSLSPSFPPPSFLFPSFLLPSLPSKLDKMNLWGELIQTGDFKVRIWDMAVTFSNNEPRFLNTGKG